MAGHSHWANIQHKKARVDAKRGQVWSKCAKAIIVAAKSGGGDPATNLSLRYAIDEAKAANMPKDTIKNAIKKGTGELASESYEAVIYEGYGPSGIAIMLEILTDNRNRTAPEIKRIFDKFGGNLGTSGCVAYMFQQRGQFFITKKAVSEEKLMEIALEAGAEDVTDGGESWQVLCEPSNFASVRQALDSASIPMESSDLAMIPTTTVTCTGEVAAKALKLMEALEDHEDVQKVHANFEIPDAELAGLQ